MILLPIKEHLFENDEFINNPLCTESLYMTVDFYKRIGFNIPWIGYYASENNGLVGMAGFKGQPANGTIEIAYGTFEKYRNRGIGSAICRQLVELSLQANPSIRITAGTLAEPNFSTKILEKNNFKYLGPVDDPEDGIVWEWEYQTGRKSL